MARLPEVPRRHRICVRSRIAVGDDEGGAPIPDGEVVSLEEPEGRRSLLRAVWGGAGAPVEIAGLGVVEGGEPTGEPMGSYLGVPWTTTPAMGHVVRPSGAPEGADAVVVACLLECTVEDGAAVTLHFGWCDEMEILLDDGSTVIVNAGRVHLDAPRHAWEEPDDDVVNRILSHADPMRGRYRSRTDDPFPHEEAKLLRVGSGDRVAVFGPLRDRALPGTGGAYRTAASASVLVPPQPPLIKKIPKRRAPW